MSQVLILAVGQRPPGWVSTACSDYLGRFGRRLTVELKEIPPARRSGAQRTAALAQEDARLMAALKASEGADVAVVSKLYPTRSHSGDPAGPRRR